MTWVDSEEWIQKKFDELEKQGVSQIMVLLERNQLQELGIEPSVMFGRDTEKATTFAMQMARKRYKVLLVSPTGLASWHGMFRQTVSMRLEGGKN